MEKNSICRRMFIFVGGDWSKGTVLSQAYLQSQKKKKTKAFTRNKKESKPLTGGQQVKSELSLCFNMDSPNKALSLKAGAEGSQRPADSVWPCHCCHEQSGLRACYC